MHIALKGFLGLWGTMTLAFAGIAAFDDGAQSGAAASGAQPGALPTPAAKASETFRTAAEPSETSPVVAAALKASSKAKQIAACKIALALMNDRDVTTFSGESAGLHTVKVEWRSPDDGRRWQAVCEKTGKSSLRWAAYNAFGDGQQGRWRTEDTIRMKVNGDRITVTVKQPGWPEKSGSYHLDELS